MEDDLGVTKHNRGHESSSIAVGPAGLSRKNEAAKTPKRRPPTWACHAMLADLPHTRATTTTIANINKCSLTNAHTSSQVRCDFTGTRTPELGWTRASAPKTPKIAPDAPNIAAE